MNYIQNNLDVWRGRLTLPQYNPRPTLFLFIRLSRKIESTKEKDKVDQIMCFQKLVTEKHEIQEIEGKLKVMIKSIPGITIEGSASVNLNKEVAFSFKTKQECFTNCYQLFILINNIFCISGKRYHQCNIFKGNLLKKYRLYLQSLLSNISSSFKVRVIDQSTNRVASKR